MFQSGVLRWQQIMVDEAGNAYFANNWEMIEPLSPNPNRTTSTRGGGTGFYSTNVINPLLGGPRFPNGLGLIKNKLLEPFARICFIF